MYTQMTRNSEGLANRYKKYACMTPSVMMSVMQAYARASVIKLEDVRDWLCSQVC